ncbi:MAG: hypothetical protein PHF86_04070 [Candidatus Nanoarchaeia archaeon]|jgi:hypothetical protein|nr:hypothetical protein [Candidatus Nanoarchaeia archaeon]
MTQFSAVGFTGSKLPQLANAIGNGVANYLLASAFYQGVSVGVGTGAGVGTGFVQGIVGPVTATNIMGMMTAVGFTGSKALQLSNAIGNAFASFIAMGIVNSSSVGMAVGTGTGKIVGIAGPAMGSSIMGMFTAVGFTGSKAPQLANAIGNGICNTILSSGIVMTTIVGAGYPPNPMTGIDMGKLT